LIGGENGSISFTALSDKPVIPTTAAEVGARPYNWTPDYSEILGTKPPANADNTSAFVGNKLTYIDANGIYSGTISADNINGGTITGITVQTSYSGKRIMMIGDLLACFDDNEVARVSMDTSSYNDYNYSLQFRDADGIMCGDLYANSGAFAIRSNGYIDIQCSDYGNLYGNWQYGGSEILTASNYTDYISAGGNSDTATFINDINDDATMYFTTTSSNVALWSSIHSKAVFSAGTDGRLFVFGIQV
jgi:hypothetical protein